MLQQQVYVINIVLMVIDALCVITSGYVAYYIKFYLSGGTWAMDTTVFVVSVLFVMFLNNYLMGRFHLYGDTKPPSSISLLLSILMVVAIDFAFLSTSVFLYKELHYSRSFLLYFAILSFGLIAIARMLTQIYFNFLSKRGFNVRRIIVIGDTQRCKIVMDTLQYQLSYGHKIIGLVTIHREDVNGRLKLSHFRS